MAKNYDISPTLVQCFGIILTGYLIGKFKYIPPSQSKGVEKFCVAIILPVVIFKAMVEVDFYTVKWSFWFSLLLGKSVVFLVVLITTLALKKNGKFGAAGLYSIFVTQSNDIAFGLPIVKAVFNDPNTESLVDYIFLAAPINLAILNPIAFTFMEYQKARDVQQNSKKPFQLRKICLTTLKGVATNPLIFTIIFGIGLNFAFHQKLPTLIDGFFTSLSAAFSSTALFILGMKLGSQQNQLRGLQHSLPVILVILKGVILPIVLILIVKYFVGNDGNFDGYPAIRKNDTGIIQYANSTAYGTFAFLYGTFPTAPTVLLYGSKYNTGEQMVGSGLVAGTIFSAPIIFASVKMLQVNNMVDVDMFYSLIADVSKSASIISVVACAYALCVLFVLKSYKHKPHRQTIIFIMFQTMLGFTGSLFEKYSAVPDNSLRVLIFFMLLATYSYPVWYSMIAINLSLISLKRQMSPIISWLTHLIAFGVPLAMALIVALKEKDVYAVANGSSFYFIFSRFGRHSSICIAYTIIHLVAMFSGFTAVFLLRKPGLVDSEKSKLVKEKSKIYKSLINEEGVWERLTTEDGINDDVTTTIVDDNSADNIEIMETIEMDRFVNADKCHVTRHIVLLLVMFFVILLNLIIALWCDVEKTSQGMTLKLVMLSVVLTHGQGFFSFVIFGFLKEFYALPCFEWLCSGYLKLMGKKKIVLVNEEDLETEIITLCKCFVNHHLQACSKDIVTNLRSKLKTFEGVFTGTSLVDWLVNEGLVDNRSEATIYGSNLLQGRIIEHYSQRHFFYDLPYFYRFTNKGLEMSVTLDTSNENLLEV